MTASGRGLLPLGATERRPLDLGLLRADLAALWSEEGRGVARACHGTLVVSVPRAEEAEPLIDDLVRSRPSRTLLLETGTVRSAGEIEAWATGSCYRDPSEHALICSETVRLVVGPGTEARTASAIRSLTVGGLPLEVLVLDGSPLRTGWLTPLGAEVDRVIYRSGGMAVADAAALWVRDEDPSRRPRFHDVTWAELEGWRGVVASGFDGDASPLARLRRVRLVAGEGDGGLPPALLFAGWLGSRLGWGSPVRERSGAWRLESGSGGNPRLEIETHPACPYAAGLGSVRLEFDGGAPPRTWRWSEEARAWEIEGETRRRVRGAAESPCAAILRVLRQPKQDRVARDAFRLAAALAGSATR